MRSFAGAAAFADARATRLAYPSSRRTPPCLVAAASCRCARVSFASRAHSRARPCGPRCPRTGVHPSTRAPQPWRRGWAFGPFSCLCRCSPPCLGRPHRRDPAVAMWVARTVAKRRGRHVLGRPEHTAVHPVAFAPTNCWRRARRRPCRRAGLCRAPVRAPSRPAPSPTGAHHAQALPRAAHTAAHPWDAHTSAASSSPHPRRHRSRRERRRPYRARPVE
jgi:hypothetical protein